MTCVHRWCLHTAPGMAKEGSQLATHACHQWGGGEDQEHVTDCYLQGSIKGDIVQVGKVHSSFANTGYPLQAGGNNVTGGWLLAFLAR